MGTDIASLHHVASQLQQFGPNGPNGANAAQQNNGPNPAPAPSNSKALPNAHESAEISRRLVEPKQRPTTPQVRVPSDDGQVHALHMLLAKPPKTFSFITSSGARITNSPNFVSLKTQLGDELIFDRNQQNYIFKDHKTGAVFAARADGKFVVQEHGSEVIGDSDGTIRARRADGVQTTISPGSAGVEFQLVSGGFLSQPAAHNFEAMQRLKQGLGTSEVVQKAVTPADAGELNAAQLFDYEDRTTQPPTAAAAA